MSDVKHKLTLCKGVEGMCVYLNDYRIAGPKPWGGGPIIKEWTVSEKDLALASKTARPARLS